MSGTGSHGQRHDGIERTVKDFWSSRPRRPRQDRKVAGVAAAIGNRYGIDPVIVRVVFVVATVVGGFGLLLYLLGWLFLPEEGDEVSGGEALLGKGRSSMSSGMAIVLTVALIPVASGAFGGMWFSGGGFFLLLALAVGLFVLHRNRGELNRPTTQGSTSPGEPAPASFHAQPSSASASAPPSASATATAPPSASATAAASASASASQDAATPQGTATGPAAEPAGQPAAEPSTGWDPLGASPLDWDLPDPVAQAPAEAPQPPLPVRRRNSKVGPATVGLALLTAAAGTALWLAGAPWFSPAHIIGLTLGVLGIGMVVSAFTGGGRWLIAFATPLAVAGLVLTVAPLNGLPRGGVGQLDETPRVMTDLESTYERSVGSVRLDLTQLRDADGDYAVVVRAGLGEAVVVVPADAEVRFNCHSAIGSMQCLGRERHGLGNPTLSGTDPGDTGQTITLDVSSVMGSVEVTRG